MLSRPLLALLLLGCGPDPAPGGGRSPTATDCDVDEDGDGFTACVDCDDTDDRIHPEAAERCDGIDEDCDGEVDLDFAGIGVCSVDWIVTDAADLLLVVDNSCSMSDEQPEIASLGTAVHDAIEASGLDYQVGVISTDMDNASHQGKLRQAAGVRWVHASTPNPTNVLSSMISMGTTGSSSTRGLDAVYAALEVQAAGYNEGFRREGAPLGVVVMSDDDDHSAISPADFEAWFTGLDGDPTLHAIVPTADGACAPDPVGLVYLDVVGATGGITSPSCAAGWADVIEGAVERFDPQGRSRFALEQTPIPETLRAEVDTSGVLVVYEAAELGWEEDTNTVVLPTPAVADAQVTIRYAQTPRPN